MRRRRGRRGRLSLEDKLLIAGAILVGALVIWGGVHYVNSIINQPVLDPITGCPDSGFKSHTVFLVDKTNRLDKSQSNAVGDIVDRVVGKMGEGDKLSLFELGYNDPFLSGPIFVSCLPETGENASEFSQNPDQLKREFKRKFTNPLEQSVKQIQDQSDGEASQSKIIEALMELTNREDFGFNSPNRRLILVSDMLQHSDLFSIYHQPMNDPGKGLNWDSILMRSPDLTGVNVEIVLLLRPESKGGIRQNNALVSFWEQYLTRVGATLTRAKKVN